MTREEFMDIVYFELHSDGDNNRANRIIDAADEYAEQESCGDCISRQVAIDALCHVDEYNGRSVAAIKNLPPVTPQPKTGHWINKSKQSSCGVNFIHIECSKCGEPSGLNNTYARYCPWCGAKMIKS